MPFGFVSISEFVAVVDPCDWDARAWNVAGYKAAEDDIKRLGIPEGRGDFHALSWLQYANLMLVILTKQIRTWSMHGQR